MWIVFVLTSMIKIGRFLKSNNKNNHAKNYFEWILVDFLTWLMSLKSTKNIYVLGSLLEAQKNSPSALKWLSSPFEVREDLSKFTKYIRFETCLYLSITIIIKKIFLDVNGCYQAGSHSSNFSKYPFNYPKKMSEKEKRTTTIIFFYPLFYFHVWLHIDCIRGEHGLD